MAPATRARIHRQDGGKDQRRLEAFSEDDERGIGKGIGLGKTVVACHDLRRLVQLGLEFLLLFLNLLAGNALSDRIAELRELPFEIPSKRIVFGEQSGLGHFKAVEVGFDGFLVSIFLLTLGIKFRGFTQAGARDEERIIGSLL